MNKIPTENEKDKEIEKASEGEGDEDWEREEVESAQEGSRLEEAAPSEKSVPPDTGKTPGSPSDSEDESKIETELEFQKTRERWMSLTGKKPRNIPVIKRYIEVDQEKVTLFGDRRQLEVEKKIAERLLIAAKKLSTKARNLGKVRKEIWLPTLSNGLMCVRFDPNSEKLAIADRNGQTQIRDRDTGNIILHLRTIEETERMPVRTLRYHPLDREKLFLAGECGVIQVFHKETGLMVGASQNLTTINCMDISSEGSFLVTGGRDGKINVLDTNILQVISQRVWPKLDEKTSPEITNQFHRLRIYGARFHPEDKNLFVTGSCDRSVKIWDVRIPTATQSINGPAVFGDSLDISNNMILTAAWQAENSIGLWEFPSGKPIKSIPIKNQYSNYDGEFLFCGQFFKTDPAYPSVNSNLIAVGGGGFTQLLVVNIKSEKVSAHFPSYKPIYSLDLIGNLVAYGGKESIFRVGEVEGTLKD